MKVICYGRVSTEEQANGLSLESQCAKMRAYASLYGLEIVEIILDPGESAKSLKRPGIQEALRLLKSGEADGLLIVKLDRLTRSVADWQDLIDEFFGERSGKTLFSVNDSIDTRTAAGRLVLNVLITVAQWEREATAERTRDALQQKISKGERCGKVRYGYDLDADGVNLVPNMAEQHAIELMRSLRAAGYSLRQIAEKMTREGIATREGRQWNHNSVEGILRRSQTSFEKPCGKVA